MSFEEDYWKLKIQRSMIMHEPLPRMSTMTYKNWNNNIGTREQEFFQNTSPLRLHSCPEMHITQNPSPFYKQLGYIIQTMFNFHTTSSLTEFLVFWYGLGLRETAWLIEKSTNLPRLVMRVGSWAGLYNCNWNNFKEIIFCCVVKKKNLKSTSTNPSVSMFAG